MTAWLDRLARLRTDAGPPSDANYQWQANKHAAETYIGFDGCPEFLAAAVNLWSLLVATVQAAEKLRVAYTDVSPADEEGLAHPAELRRLWAAVDEANSRLGYSLELLRAEVEKLP